MIDKTRTVECNVLKKSLQPIDLHQFFARTTHGRIRKINLSGSPMRTLTCLFLCCLYTLTWAADIEKGREINGTCAACHGDDGRGGKRGEYPRIAGQPAKFLENQLRNFRARVRINLPMFPYTQEKELSDADIADVAAYLSGIALSSDMPTYRGDEDALTRLRMAEKVMIIPRAEGNAAAGGETYRDECAHCHGQDAMGRGRYPMLVGQYTNYLKRQTTLFRQGDRPHDEDDTSGVLQTLKRQQAA
ncbi:MAG: c-type cytochrome [Azonexus sp.]|nr:c-type cytochrome [Azonexus sp.]